jgi:putative (di)nucleoside polyphosphate hydrolase
MLRLLGSDTDFDLGVSESPEFDHWRWVDYWYPMQAVVHFKQSVYDRALREFAPLLFPDGHPTARPPQRRRDRRRHRPRRPRSENSD